MAGKIFINYRRDDAPDSAGFLDYLLEQEFSREIVFKDVDSIKLGDDFEAILSAEVANCDVFLSVIGTRWNELISARRDDPKDFVRIEIKAALSQGKRVIPVLVQGAEMPNTQSLPDDIKALATRNAIRLRPEKFSSDTHGLIAGLRSALAEAQEERERTEAERAIAEEVRRKQEEEDAARRSSAAERARAQASSGLSSEEILKAEELANWEFVKKRSDIGDLRDHIARFGDEGTTSRYALVELEELVWRQASAAADASNLRAFLDEFPNGENAPAARAELAELENKAAKAAADAERARDAAKAWAVVASSINGTEIEAFLRDWPDSEFAGAARNRLVELRSVNSGFQEVVMAAAWLVFSLGAALGLGVLFDEHKWLFISTADVRVNNAAVLSGWIVGTVLVFASAAIMSLLLKLPLRSPAFAIYWMGVTIAVSWLCAPFFDILGILDFSQSSILGVAVFIAGTLGLVWVRRV